MPKETKGRVLHVQQQQRPPQCAHCQKTSFRIVDGVDDKDAICSQCLTQFSGNRTRKIYTWKVLQNFIDTRMATHEQSKQDATARSAKNLCVCSTPEDEVTGTALVGIFKWSEQYPLLCPDCAEVWRRYHYKKTKKDTALDFSTLEKFVTYVHEIRAEEAVSYRDDPI